LRRAGNGGSATDSSRSQGCLTRTLPVSTSIANVFPETVDFFDLILRKVTKKMTNSNLAASNS
jgi:hypothetical protein